MLLLFYISFKQIIFTPPPTKEHKITLNLKQIQTSPPTPMPQTPLPPQPTPLQKKSEPLVKKEVFKQKHLDKNKKVFAKKSVEENNNTTTKVKAKPIKKLVKKKKPIKIKKRVQKKQIKIDSPKKRIVKKQKTKRSKDPLANMLMGSGTSLFVQKPTSSQNSYGARMIKQLYGSEFHTFSPVQKKFIRRNLSTIHKITQRTLTRNGYPDVAKRTKQQGTNIVSFYLHPNGDISGLRLKRPIGYEALDENTLKVIRIAYKDYPLPNKKTKIIFYVNYRIY